MVIVGHSVITTLQLVYQSRSVETPCIDFTFSSSENEDQTVTHIHRVVKVVKFTRTSFSDIFLYNLPFLGLARLLRLLRLNVLLMKLEEHIDSDVWLATFILIKMFLGLFVLSHWLACVWWSIGVAHEDSDTNWIRDNQLDEEGHFATK